MIRQEHVLARHCVWTILQHTLALIWLNQRWMVWAVLTRCVASLSSHVGTAGDAKGETPFGGAHQASITEIWPILLGFSGAHVHANWTFWIVQRWMEKVLPYCHHNQVGRKCQKCQRGWSHVCLSWPSQQICLFFWVFSFS